MTAKFRAGLAGQSRPLRELGVDLTDARVKAVAAGQGVRAFGGQLSQSQKFGARMAIIMHDMASSVGDVAATFGSTKNQTRALFGRLENLSNLIGQALEPAYNSLLHTANSVVKGITSAWEDQNSRFNKYAAAFGRFFGKLYELYDGLKNVVGNMLSRVGDKFGKMLEGLRKTDPFIDSMLKVWEGAGGGIIGVLDAITDAVDKVAVIIRNWDLWSVLAGEHIYAAWANIAAVGEYVGKVLGASWQYAKDAWAAYVDFMTKSFVYSAAYILDIGSQIVANFTVIGKQISEILSWALNNPITLALNSLETFGLALKKVISGRALSIEDLAVKGIGGGGFDPAKLPSFHAPDAKMGALPLPPLFKMPELKLPGFGGAGELGADIAAAVNNREIGRLAANKIDELLLGKKPERKRGDIEGLPEPAGGKGKAGTFTDAAGVYKHIQSALSGDKSELKKGNLILGQINKGIDKLNGKKDNPPFAVAGPG